MKYITLQRNPIVPVNKVISDIESIICRYGYRGNNVQLDSGVAHLRVYEIPAEGAVYLFTTDRPAPQSIASNVALMGFDESNSRTLKSLETDVNQLALTYLKADTDLIGQAILDALSK